MLEEKQTIPMLPTIIPNSHKREHNKMIVKSVGFGVVRNAAINNNSERQQRVYKLSPRDSKMDKYLGVLTIRKISFLIRKSGAWPKAPRKKVYTNKWNQVILPDAKDTRTEATRSRIRKEFRANGEGDEYRGK